MQSVDEESSSLSENDSLIGFATENECFYYAVSPADIAKDKLAAEEMEKYENCQDNANSNGFSMQIHIEEIEKYQQTTKLLIAPQEFETFVANLQTGIPSTFQLNACAMLTLQSAAESFLTQLFEFCSLTASNAESMRNMITAEDISFVIHLWTKERKLFLHQHKNGKTS